MARLVQRVAAEALRHPIRDRHIHAIRWDGGEYVLDAWPLDQVDTADPRKFHLLGGGWRVMALTSLSWLLPVELTPDGGGTVLDLRHSGLPLDACTDHEQGWQLFVVERLVAIARD